MDPARSRTKPRLPSTLSALALLASLAAGGCASTPALPHHPQGSDLGPGMRSFDLVRRQAREEVRQPWAPADFYPGLPTRLPKLPAPHGVAKAGEAERARADSPLVSRGFGAASGWLFFKLYQNSFSRVDGATCRFHPSCSGFGLQAVGEYGLTGVLMTFGRLQKNHQDDTWYPAHEDTHKLADPVEGYGFFFGQLRFDDFARFDDPSHAWLMHVQAAEAASSN